jgi:hypothetical protein
MELEHAFHQGQYFAGIAKKLKGSAWSCHRIGLRWPLLSAHTVDKHLQLHRIVNSLVCSFVVFRNWCIDLWNFWCRVPDMCAVMNWLHVGLGLCIS